MDRATDADASEAGPLRPSEAPVDGKESALATAGTGGHPAVDEDHERLPIGSETESPGAPNVVDGPSVDLEDLASTDATLRTQLEQELLKRRPDRFLVGVICRELGGVPNELRATVWKELLGVARNERVHYLDQSISRVEEDLANQKVIAADATRTRATDALFRQPETVELIVKLLTFYCKSRNLRYKQGMNEVLAPFLMLERGTGGLPEGVVFQLFYAMIDKFLPHVFVDREFKSLQCSFQLYRLLLLYHDPMLCNYLDQHAMIPELYVTPWFMTLFARNLPEELVFVLWDFFILHEDPYLLHFVALALVHAHRATILAADVSMLPQVLSGIAFKDRQDVELVCAAAAQLMDATPLSFKRDLYSVCYGGYNDQMVPFLRQLMGASSLQVYPDELVANLMNRISPAITGVSPGIIATELSAQQRSLSERSFSAERAASLSSVFFIVLDCRPLDQYRECHLSLSYHIDPDVVASPDALSVLIKGFTRMKGCHFCFVGPSMPTSMATKAGGALEAISKLTRGISGERQQLEAASAKTGIGVNSPPQLKKEHITVTRLVLMFLQKGFEHVSRLDGGFDELRKEIDGMDSFAQEQLLVFPDPAPEDTVNSSGGLKSLARRALERVRTLSEDDPTIAVSENQPTPSPTDASQVTANLKAKTKATVSSISQRFQILTSAAKDAVTASKSGGAPGSEVSAALTEERRILVGEEEWIEVCQKTREALEKSLCFKDVVFQHGSLGILFQRSKHKKYMTVVDSLVPESQASESQQIEHGDLLISINGQDLVGIQFNDVIELIKDASRPLVLRFQNPKKKPLDSFDAISIPPLPPILISASHHSICLSWNKLSDPNTRYQLQYAQQSDYNFNPWLSVPMKQESNAELDRTGITTHHNGTMVGIDPGTSLVFRVRCGYGEKWGPYSLSSSTMMTLEKGVDDDTTPTADSMVVMPVGATSPPMQFDPSGSPLHRSMRTAVFLPGECPEFFERGTFYFRVLIGLRARMKPAFDAEKLDVVLERGSIIKCCERLVAPGTNQVFVRLAPDWNISRNKQRSRFSSKDGLDDCEKSNSVQDDDENGAWAFENTPEGAAVLERLPEFSEESYNPPVPLQEQARSLVSSLFTAGGIKTSAATTQQQSRPASPKLVEQVVPQVALVAPRILTVFAASGSEIAVTWDPVNDVGITKYQIQYAKNRLAAIWWTWKQDIGSDTLKCNVSELAPSTPYVFRIRSGNADVWGPFSDSSEPCKTLDEVKPVVAPEPVNNGAIDRDVRPSTFSSIFGGSFTATSASTTAATTTQEPKAPPQPIRTGSTLLDKAVAAATRLTRPKLAVEEIECGEGNSSPHAFPQEGDLVDLSVWKAELLASGDGESRTFVGIRYLSTPGSHSPNMSDHRSSDANSDAETGQTTSGALASPISQSSDSSLLRWSRVGERELIVTPSFLFAVVKPSCQLDASEAVVETRRPLSALAKITSKKTIPNSIVFHFRRSITDSDLQPEEGLATEQLCFVVSNKNDCVAFVKQSYQGVQPKPSI